MDTQTNTEKFGTPISGDPQLRAGQMVERRLGHSRHKLATGRNRLKKRGKENRGLQRTEILWQVRAGQLFSFRKFRLSL
jgi:hypothetical protein